MLVKDYLKFRNSVKKDKNLGLKEAYFLEVLFDYYNVDKQIAYPSYKVLMADLKTTRKNNISKLIKSLVEKGYIEVIKVGRKNTYKILKHLHLFDKSAKTQPKTEEVELSEEVKTVVDATNVTVEQAEELLKINDNIAEVIEALDVTDKKGGIKNRVAYAKTVLKNGVSLVSNKIKSKTDKSFKPSKPSFNNFTGRNYDYNKLEQMLLGWDEETDLSSCMI